MREASFGFPVLRYDRGNDDDLEQEFVEDLAGLDLRASIVDHDVMQIPFPPDVPHDYQHSPSSLSSYAMPTSQMHYHIQYPSSLVHVHHLGYSQIFGYVPPNLQPTTPAQMHPVPKEVKPGQVHSVPQKVNPNQVHPTLTQQGQSRSTNQNSKSTGTTAVKRSRSEVVMAHPRTKHDSSKRRRSENDFQESVVDAATMMKFNLGLRQPQMGGSKRIKSIKPIIVLSDDDCTDNETNEESVEVRKGTWDQEEDERLMEILNANPDWRWGQVAALIPGRSAKQCRERWNCNLDPAIVRNAWTPEEDRIVMALHRDLGNKWAMIAGQLHGRTENAVKTRYKSIIRAQKREWSPSEDELLVDLQSKHGSDWDSISVNFPKRTRNAVKTRYRMILKGLVTDEPPELGAPNQILYESRGKLREKFEVISSAPKHGNDSGLSLVLGSSTDCEMNSGPQKVVKDYFIGKEALSQRQVKFECDFESKTCDMDQRLYNTTIDSLGCFSDEDIKFLNETDLHMHVHMQRCQW